MIDDVFEVCFELLLLIVLAKRSMSHGAGAGLPANPISRGWKKLLENRCIADSTLKFLLVAEWKINLWRVQIIN
jgi:hypothetical protein